jgi:hypothetical protein
VLVNTYRLLQRVSNAYRRPKNLRGFSKKVRVLPRLRRKKAQFFQYLLKKKFLAPRFISVEALERGFFPLKVLRQKGLNLKLERFLSNTLQFPVEIRLKNVFSLKKKKKGNSVITLCRAVYKTTKNF